MHTAEFVQLVSAQANSNKQATIQPQHVIDALEQLEFTELSADIANHWREFQAGTASRGVPAYGVAICCGCSAEHKVEVTPPEPNPLYDRCSFIF